MVRTNDIDSIVAALLEVRKEETSDVLQRDKAIGGIEVQSTNLKVFLDIVGIG